MSEPQQTGNKIMNGWEFYCNMEGRPALDYKKYKNVRQEVMIYEIVELLDAYREYLEWVKK